MLNSDITETDTGNTSISVGRGDVTEIDTSSNTDSIGLNDVIAIDTGSFATSISRVMSLRLTLVATLTVSVFMMSLRYRRQS
jgi:hypothetical protein